jgi:N-formylmaleamate deformylase
MSRCGTLRPIGGNGDMTGTEWQSGDVVANGVRQHYYRTGGAKPPLVLAHGATDDGLCWTPLAKVLEADYDVVMPDARGHGLSAAPSDGFGAAERAADLAALIRALGLERPAVGGHSMGAGTTLQLIATEPDLARCAILEDPGLRPPGAGPSDAEQEARRQRMRANAEANKAMSREALIASAREHNPSWSEDELGPWADSKQRLSLAFVEARRGPEPTAWQDLLRRVRCPVLLVTADPERGAIVTPEAAEEAGGILPGLRVVRLSGAGHNIRREQFGPYLRAVRAFLAET